MDGTATSITLRAVEGEPLADPAVRDMVEATAHAIAERQGIEVIDLQISPASLTAALRTGRIEAVGFAAELRRLTTTWYTKKYGESTLWGGGPERPDDDEPWRASLDGDES